MKIRLAIVTLLFVVGTILAQDSAAESKNLNGMWIPASGEVAGTKFPPAELKTISLVIAGDKYTVTVGKLVDQGIVKIDPAAKPKTMDIVGTEGPNKGKTLLAIYELDKDTLRVCYDLTGKSRPKEFSTSKDRPYFLAVYERVKK